jgi:hypothetical protein
VSSEDADTGIGECFGRNENDRGYQEEVTRNKRTYQEGTKQSQIPIPYWSMGVRRVTRKTTYVCGLCLEPFRLEGRENRCISLCEKCWDICDAESA